jgi:hypothetical protein
MYYAYLGENSLHKAAYHVAPFTFCRLLSNQRAAFIRALALNHGRPLDEACVPGIGVQVWLKICIKNIPIYKKLQPQTHFIFRLYQLLLRGMGCSNPLHLILRR